MSDSRKKRISMLDSLAAARPAGQESSGPPSSMTANRALRAARDAVDGHHVWELDPDQIIDTRIADRLDPRDVADLREAIETNGQAVPILVRRHPDQPDTYLLVYGRRRLEAIRSSGSVPKIRALVANLNDDDAVRAQISENMARRDLTFIEKALFARELVDSGFGTQSQVAEVLTVTKSSVSMALTIIDMLGRDLAQAIGPGIGIGRPRWEALARLIEERGADAEELADLARETHSRIGLAQVIESDSTPPDASVAAFDAVMAHLEKQARTRPAQKTDRNTQTARSQPVTLDGQHAGRIRGTDQGLRVDLTAGPFADWLENRADSVLQDLHAQWKTTERDRAEDRAENLAED